MYKNIYIQTRKNSNKILLELMRIFNEMTV